MEIPISLEFLPLPVRLMISTLLLKRRGKAVQCSVWHSAARLPFVQMSVARIPVFCAVLTVSPLRDFVLTGAW